VKKHPRRTDLFAIFLAVCLPVTAYALDFRSVAIGHAVMFDAPSVQAKKLYIVSQYMPVEVIVNLGEWIKVRDSSGELAWLEAKSLNSKRTVLVTVPHLEAHESADATSPVVFHAEKNVALELTEAGSNGWAKVRHRDGLVGYVSATQVWGL
jgi:SH3-like domain-containing protein